MSRDLFVPPRASFSRRRIPLSTLTRRIQSLFLVRVLASSLFQKRCLITYAGPINGEPVGATLAWMAAHLHEDLTVEQMAARAVMSPRAFARHSRATLGTTPYQWLLQQRIVLAQRLLETTDETIERVATCCGFSSAATFRLHFQRFLHTSPQAYRNAFHRENLRETASYAHHR